MMYSARAHGLITEGFVFGYKLKHLLVLEAEKPPFSWSIPRNTPERRVIHGPCCLPRITISNFTKPCSLYVYICFFVIEVLSSKLSSSLFIRSTINAFVREIRCEIKLILFGGRPHRSLKSVDKRSGKILLDF